MYKLNTIRSWLPEHLRALPCCLIRRRAVDGNAGKIARHEQQLLKGPPLALSDLDWGTFMQALAQSDLRSRLLQDAQVTDSDNAVCNVSPC